MMIFYLKAVLGNLNKEAFGYSFVFWVVLNHLKKSTFRFFIFINQALKV